MSIVPVCPVLFYGSAGSVQLCLMFLSVIFFVNDFFSSVTFFFQIFHMVWNCLCLKDTSSMFLKKVVLRLSNILNFDYK